jgi:hypothetical protein
LFVYKTQRGAKDRSATQSVQGQTSIKRYLCYPSFSCVSLDRFERNSMSTLIIFCLRVKVKLFEVIHLSAGRFSYNRNWRLHWGDSLKSKFLVFDFSSLTLFYPLIVSDLVHSSFDWFHELIGSLTHHTQPSCQD